MCRSSFFSFARLMSLSTPLKKVEPLSAPDYFETFLNFWQGFINMPGIYLTGSGTGSEFAAFGFQHTWFLTFLFFITLIVVLLSLPFKGKSSEPKKVDGRKIIILQTILLAVVLGIFYAAAMVYYAHSWY